MFETKIQPSQQEILLGIAQEVMLAITLNPSDCELYAKLLTIVGENFGIDTDAGIYLFGVLTVTHKDNTALLGHDASCSTGY